MLYKLVLLVTVCFVSPSEAFSHHYPALNRRTVVTQVALARTEEFDSVVPRLHPDVNGLVEWSEKEGQLLHVALKSALVKSASPEDSGTLRNVGRKTQKCPSSPRPEEGLRLKLCDRQS